MKRVRVIVDGRVQGVGFRYFVNNTAKRYAIKGFVRNLADGKVEIDAEGECDNVHHFLTDCRTGPALSRVDAFLISEVPEYGFEGFRIKF
ncbi:acylphosphatase [Marinilabiliaceae bacterium JC017]|nr:acylphosphatase [Marinilabiliaceae bacterium JC017]